MEVALARGRVTPAEQEALSDMLEAARHLSKVANDLLMLAEVGHAPKPGHHVVVDLGAVAHQSVAMFSGVAEEEGVELSATATAPAAVHGDPIDLRRLTSNLLDNAIRYTPPGGSVRMQVIAAADAAILTVSDTGSGIAPRDLEHVFDRFFKADPSRTHGGGRRSSGLGLAICRSIVDTCGGTIGIESRLGQGTTVTVRLPLAVGQVPDTPADRTSPVPPKPQPAAG